ncbi:MAG TPA: nickel pincer cofactor biosynthesis protein LarB [Peptococcaceae bacterium]|nr:nickel pincer cofactor biosynthesis protein LarB [Peptococcaceae bacterium]
MSPEEKVRKLLESVRTGAITVTEAMHKLKHLPYQDLGFAKIDHHRTLRLGFPEVVYCKGKTPEQVLQIIEELRKHNHRILATKVNKKTAKAVIAQIPSAHYHPEAKLLVIGEIPEKPIWGKITVVTAGTADLPVAEEAALTAKILENEVERIYDIGVAGLHRLFSFLPNLSSALAIIVVAGMDGALPSIVAGLVDRPVIAVPTSTGYGANFQGLAPLLTMLNSCAPGVSVVNIDNGFGAAFYAHLITRSGGTKNEGSIS